MRTFVAVITVSVVTAALALGLLLLSRLVQPGSPVVNLGMVPRPLRWVTRHASRRSMRVWCPDPDLAAALVPHWSGPHAAVLDRLGVAPVTAPELADVVALPRPDDAAVTYPSVPDPHATVVLADPTDADAVLRVFISLAETRDTSGFAPVPDDVTP